MPTASASVFSPHQPVEIVQVPKPTSETVTSVPGKVLYFMADLEKTFVGSSVFGSSAYLGMSGLTEAGRRTENRRTDERSFALYRAKTRAAAVAKYVMTTSAPARRIPIRLSIIARS